MFVVDDPGLEAAYPGVLVGELAELEDVLVGEGEEGGGGGGCLFELADYEVE